jgi:alpha-ketoglutarate-dependent taurine dioxygenase
LEVRATGDVDLATWAATHTGLVDAWLHRAGAILFTGFGIGLDEFARVATVLAGEALPYLERSSPRTELTPGVYTSTDYPADQPIGPHNENSYQLSFPARLVFCCVTEAGSGGATPLADCRRVLARIDPAVVAEFRRRGVRYVRTYATGVGVSWQDAFQETDPAGVDAYCEQRGIATHWEGERLRTVQVRPAVARHPHTGEEVWFNHAAFFHVSAHPLAIRTAMLDQFGVEGLPVNSYYGDGTAIEAETLHDIRAAYAAESVARPWRRGDVLLVDNLLAAHGREPFTGPRRIIVSMAGELRHAEATG